MSTAAKRLLSATDAVLEATITKTEITLETVGLRMRLGLGAVRLLAASGGLVARGRTTTRLQTTAVTLGVPAVPVPKAPVASVPVRVPASHLGQLWNLRVLENVAATLGELMAGGTTELLLPLVFVVLVATAAVAAALRDVAAKPTVAVRPVVVQARAPVAATVRAVLSLPVRVTTEGCRPPSHPYLAGKGQLHRGVPKNLPAVLSVALAVGVARGLEVSGDLVGTAVPKEGPTSSRLAVLNVVVCVLPAGGPAVATRVLGPLVALRATFVVMSQTVVPVVTCATVVLVPEELPTVGIPLEPNNGGVPVHAVRAVDVATQIGAARHQARESPVAVTERANAAKQVALAVYRQIEDAAATRAVVESKFGIQVRPASIANDHDADLADRL